MTEPVTDGRMTVVEHLVELRRRIIISLAAVALAAVLCYVFAPDIISFLLDYYRDAAKDQKQKFIFTGPLDAFLTRIKIATYGGIILAIPVWLWELWRFVTPGLNPREKRFAVPFVLSSVLLFALGGFIAMITLPQALDFLLNVGGQEVRPLLTADKYVGLVSLMILAFGIAFLFPVLLVFLLLARVLTTQRLAKWRRWAIIGIVAFAAIITPSQDPYSLFFMAVPMYVFYEASILIGKLLKR